MDNIIDVGAFLIGFSVPILTFLFLGISIKLFIWILKCLDEDEDK